MSDVDERFWGTRAKSIAAIERELSRLHRAAMAHAIEQGRTVNRASVLNLVVYAEREAHARRAARVVARLALRHPSRTVVVRADRKKERDGKEPSLELYCLVPTAREFEQVSYEQLLARFHGESDKRVASVVTPLLVPDLPVFLWWTGTPDPSARHFNDLVDLADRLIVDSADFARPDDTLPEIAHFARERSAITDLNWARLTPWRELVAQFFDVPAWRPLLDGITGVRVGFGVDMDGRDIHPSQALLFFGWLSSRLGWRAIETMAPSEAGGLYFHVARQDGARVSLRVRPRFERDLDTGDVSGVRLQATVRSTSAEFVLKRTADAQHVTATVVIDGTSRSERVVPLPAPGMEQLLGEELTISSSDHVYEDALEALLRWT